MSTLGSVYSPLNHSSSCTQLTSPSSVASAISQPLMQLESLSQLAHLQPSSSSTTSDSYTAQTVDNGGQNLTLSANLSSSLSHSTGSTSRKSNRSKSKGNNNKTTQVLSVDQSSASKSPNHTANVLSRSPKSNLNVPVEGSKISLHSPESQQMQTNVLNQSNSVDSPSSSSGPSFARPSANPVDFYSNSAFVPSANCDWATSANPINSSASYFNSVFQSQSSSATSSLDSHLNPHTSHLQHTHHLSHQPSTSSLLPSSHLHHHHHHNSHQHPHSHHHSHLHTLQSSMQSNAPEVSASSLSSHSSPTISQAMSLQPALSTHLTHLSQSIATVPATNTNDLIDPSAQNSPVGLHPSMQAHLTQQQSPQSPLDHVAHAPTQLDLSSSQPLLASHPFHHPQPGYPAQDSSPAAATTQPFAYHTPPTKRACLERAESPCHQPPPSKLARLSSDRFVKDEKSLHDSSLSSYGSVAYNGLLLGTSQSSSLEPLDSNNNSLNGLGSSFSPISAYSNYYGLSSSLGSDGTASAFAFHTGNGLHQSAIGHSIPPQYTPYNTYGNYHGYGLSSVSGTHQLFQQHLARFSALI